MCSHKYYKMRKHLWHYRHDWMDATGCIGRVLVLEFDFLFRHEVAIELIDSDKVSLARQNYEKCSHRHIARIWHEFLLLN